MAAYDDLKDHLQSFNAAPFLFVGSGLSRRYLKLGAWRALLEQLATQTKYPFSHYLIRGNGNLPNVASEIAEELLSIWSDDPAFATHRARYESTLSTREGPLKAEVSAIVTELAEQLPIEGLLADELAHLRDAVVDGVITTNYDTMLEQLFPDFRVFVGQNDMLFADSLGVGEIYKIHGSASDPESLVLTRSDFDQFTKRNPYLAAKLLSIFVEHPIVFLGYSLSDENVGEILVSIPTVLTTANLARLQDRLVFVEWDPDQGAPSMTRTVISVGGFTIPVVSVKLSDFLGLFEVLTELRRKFSPRVLRQLKEHIYELVLHNDPTGKLFVQDIEEKQDVEDFEVVLGIGIKEKLGHEGYVGVTRVQLLEDVLQEDSSYDAARIVSESLPSIFRQAGNVPIYRYLREGDFLADDGKLKDPKSLSGRVLAKFTPGMEPYLPSPSIQQRAQAAADEAGDLPGLIRTHGPEQALAYAGALGDRLNLHDLRRFLLDQTKELGAASPSSAWAKLVCLYDYLAYATVR